MPRKPTDGGLVQFNLRLPPALIEALDREVEARRRETPGTMLTRSDLVRIALYELLERAKKGR
jgi:Arc/MetJ-type ribon-helix-helix transcriptional regulator